MTFVARKVWLPWLLLLVPTLAIGTAALTLLWKEQRRIDAARAEAADRAAGAVRARTRVAAENIELLIAEIRDGLLRELAETPETELEPLLTNWPRTNPLVTQTFLWRPAQRNLIWPPADTPEHLAFRQRHAELFRGAVAGLPGVPEKTAAERESKTKLTRPQQQEDFAAQEAISSNYNLRRDVQQVARVSAQEAKKLGSDEQQRILAQVAKAQAEKPAQAEAKVAAVTAARAEEGIFDRRPALSARTATPSLADRKAVSAETEFAAPMAAALPAPAGLEGAAGVKDRAETSLAGSSDTAADAPANGWLVRAVAGSTWFLGWWQPAAGRPVRGVELNLPAVLERVQALVPAPSADGERFVLNGPGQTMASAPIRIPLSTTLPGWELAAWPGAATAGRGGAGPAFFIMSALLVLAFGGAIVAGGAMFFRQAEAAAREAALKTSFVSNVSHEMKTPLTTIRMYAEMLGDERVVDPEKRQRYFATIGRETSRLSRLVNNALDFGRLEAGRKEYRTETIALEPWLARLAEVHAPRLGEAGLQFAIAPAPPGAAVRCDGDSLDQMMLNLIDNAVKYAAGGGRIEVRVASGAGTWTLIVADRGPGVPAGHRERIFERFHRVDDALTAGTQGAGLGLTIARRLARDQRGDLVYRDRVGGGAEFQLTLPAAEEN